MWAFDYDASTAKISRRRKIIEIENGFPDGMCIDAEGCLWIAHWGAACVTRSLFCGVGVRSIVFFPRWDPSFGRLLRTISVPAQNTSACFFGGAELSDLYVTSASVRSDMKKYPLGGSLFVVKNAGKGVAAPRYAGKF